MRVLTAPQTERDASDITTEASDPSAFPGPSHHARQLLLGPPREPGHRSHHAPARPTVHTDTTALSGDSVQAPPFSSLGCGFILRGTAAGKPDSWLSYYWIQSRVSAANVYNVC